MLDATQFSELIDPVVFRAQADLNARTSGFADRAARYVLRQLGLEDERVLSQYHWQRHDAVLKRSQWIDRQALQFFSRHPTGLGVEVNAGLSTRFHRLCTRSDWPKFSWRVINNLDVTDCLNFVFPALDNHTTIASDNPTHDWYDRIYWREPIAKIVIIDDPQAVNNWTDFELLSQSIQERLTAETPVIEVILSHSLADLELRICELKSPITIADEYQQSGVRCGIIAKLQGFLSASVNPKSSDFVSRLVFYRKGEQR